MTTEQVFEFIGYQAKPKKISKKGNMTTEQVIGCIEGGDNFHCSDCRFKPNTPECDEYRMTWELDVFYEGDDDVAFASDEYEINAAEMNKKCIQLGEVLI